MQIEITQNVSTKLSQIYKYCSLRVGFISFRNHTKVISAMYQFGIILSVLLLKCPCSARKFEISPNSMGLTLQEFANDTAHLNDAALQLVLHAGNHSLSSELMISSIRELTLISTEDGKVICSNSGIFTFNNIRSLKIKHLEFGGCKINVRKSAGIF